MIDLAMKPEDQAAYLRMETALMAKERSGILTTEEAAEILDHWLTERGY